MKRGELPAKARALYAEGVEIGEIAARLGVQPSRVRRCIEHCKPEGRPRKWVRLAVTDPRVSHSTAAK